MLIYVAGPISASTTKEMEENIRGAAMIAKELWMKGHAVICPHMNTYWPVHGIDQPTLLHEDYLAGDFNILDRCDAVVMCQGWENSRGAVAEYNHAFQLGIPTYVYPDIPELNLTEVRCPVQSEAFRQMVGKMYRTHLIKNQDYSAANILGPGEVGLVARLWDKVARLMNLIGFRIKVSEPGTFETPRNPKCESIEDTYMDLAVYGVIGLLLRNGKWGK